MEKGFEKYLSDHREDLYEDLPEGALDRFLERLPDEEKESSPSKGWIFAWKTTLAMVSAAAAIVLVAVIAFSVKGPSGKGYFAAAGNDPERVYQMYISRLQSITSSVGEGSDLRDEISTVTFEAIPLLEQLPSEMSLQDKASVMKTHYGAILDGVDRMISGEGEDSWNNI
ncbi:MAG: hypothetical protein IKS22_11720 [Bacteroidales bacterium]|nr:hypothetical protein [Bacteroidales bacterium]